MIVDTTTRDALNKLLTTRGVDAMGAPPKTRCRTASKGGSPQSTACRRSSMPLGTQTPSAWPSPNGPSAPAARHQAEVLNLNL
jgi:hypothetical protein